MSCVISGSPENWYDPPFPYLSTFLLPGFKNIHLFCVYVYVRVYVCMHACVYVCVPLANNANGVQKKHQIYNWSFRCCEPLCGC